MNRTGPGLGVGPTRSESPRDADAPPPAPAGAEGALSDTVVNWLSAFFSPFEFQASHSTT